MIDLIDAEERGSDSAYANPSVEDPTLSKTFTATYDGANLRPSGALDLERDRRYLITVEEVPETPDSGDAWSELEALAGTVDGPRDWAREHDHFLYGSPKRDRDGAAE